MPIQRGIKLSGTLGDLTFYGSNGKYYVKNKSSINAKRIKTDPSFRAFRERSTQFAEATKIASSIYRTFQKGKKKHGVFPKLCAKVYKHLLTGKTESEIRKLIK